MTEDKDVASGSGESGDEKSVISDEDHRKEPVPVEESESNDNGEKTPENTASTGKEAPEEENDSSKEQPKTEGDHEKSPREKAPEMEPKRKESPPQKKVPEKQDEGSEKEEEPSPEKKEEGGDQASEKEDKPDSEPVEGRDKSEKKAKDEKKDGPSEPEKEKEPVPKVEFRPIPEDGAELLKDVEMPSRKEMVDLLVKKHRDFVDDFKKEMESLEKPPEEIMGESEEEKKKRDSINKEVAELKDKRTALKEENKKLRSRFFDLIRKEEKVKEHEKEVQVHQSFIEDLEWKMATEAIDIQTERRLLDELRGTMQKIRAITDGLTPEEIKVQLTEIEEQMGENLISIEELHTKMLEKVEESNLHHEKFIDAQKKVREKESRKGWLERRVKLHNEMAIFWEGQNDQAVQMDKEESGRDLETIRNNLMKLFSERDGVDRKKDDKSGEKDERRSKKGPRKKLEIKPSDSKSSEPPAKDEGNDHQPEKGPQQKEVA